MGAVTDGIETEIDQLQVEGNAPGLAELATSLARSVDEADAPAAKAIAARELRAVMVELRKLAPVAAKGDAVDAVGRKREERRARLQAAHEAT